MKAIGSIEIMVRSLQEALAVAVPKRRKNSRRKKAWPLTLEHHFDRSVLEITEAKHALKGYEITAEGTWPEKVQIDGHVFRQIVDKYDPEDRIELVVLEDELCLLREGSQICLKRIDSGGKPGISRKPIPQNPRHTGPVEVPPDPIGKRVELGDTWGFSARVPMSQHRKSEKK